MYPGYGQIAAFHGIRLPFFLAQTDTNPPTNSKCTLFARSDAAATIYFIAQFCAASIREWILIESGFIKLSVLGKIFRNVRALRKASL